MTFDAMQLPVVRAEWAAAASRFEAVVCEYAAPALELVNVARADRRFGAGGLAQWPDGSSYDMHPVRMALLPCGVEAVYPLAGTVDVVEAEALALARCWHPFGTAELLGRPAAGCIEVPLPVELAVFALAVDFAAALRRALAETEPARAPEEVA